MKLHFLLRRKNIVKRNFDNKYLGIRFLWTDEELCPMPISGMGGSVIFRIVPRFLKKYHCPSKHSTLLIRPIDYFKTLGFKRKISSGF